MIPPKKKTQQALDLKTPYAIIHTVDVPTSGSGGRSSKPACEGSTPSGDTEMIKKCFCCGVEKDLSVQVKYPYEEDNIATDIDVPQLFTVECQGQNEDPDNSGDFRMAVMCHDCWHRLETTRGIDMWIGQRCWESLNPITPFEKLPEIVLEYNEGKWDAENYAPVV